MNAITQNFRISPPSGVGLKWYQTVHFLDCCAYFISAFVIFLAKSVELLTKPDDGCD